MKDRCPNCGGYCIAKYCGECGQLQAHHKETFLHMLTHFVGHYFHYDSKFWITLKTLCFSPGKLTKAYHDQQRMKYIAPISLYIFVSVVFFLFFSKAFQIRATYDNSSTQYFVMYYEAGKEVKKEHKSKIMEYLHIKGDSMRNVALEVIQQRKFNDSLFKASHFSFTVDYLLYTAGNKYLLDYMYKYGELSIPAVLNEISSKFLNILPKVFFILMPLFALLLHISFFKKRGYYFVDHAVMSLHIHTFLFISLMLLFILSYIYIPDLVYTSLFFGFILPGIYFLLACRVFYLSSWIYTLIIGTMVWALYLLFVIAVSIAALFFVTIYL